MLISRRVYSPEFGIPGNTVDRTPGFYGHLPKYWNCRQNDWVYIRPEEDQEWIDYMQSIRNEQMVKHSRCRFPWHMSYNGYLCFILPRRGRLIWNYWGRPSNPTQGLFVWQPKYNRRFKRKEIFH